MPTILASAGAMTTANRIGVSRGTSSSRGVLALRAKRRRESVTKALSCFTRAGGGPTLVGVGTVVVMVVMIVHSLLKLGPQAASRSPVSRRYTSSSVGWRVLIAAVGRPI